MEGMAEMEETMEEMMVVVETVVETRAARDDVS
jgi:hypothetical protein